MNTDSFTGLWQSSYEYPSSSRGKSFTSQQELKAYQRGHTVVLESLHGSDSYLVIRLTVDEQNNVASGSWQETTNPKGHYQGATYHGVLQLLINDNYNELEGKWLGFGKDRTINVGPWRLAKVD